MPPDPSQPPRESCEDPALYAAVQDARRGILARLTKQWADAREVLDALDVPGTVKAIALCDLADDGLIAWDDDDRIALP